MHEQEAEQDLYQMIADCFEMDEKQNNIGCSLHYCMPGNNILEINYTKFKKDFVVSITDLGLYLFRSGVGFLWYEISLPQGAAADEIMLFKMNSRNCLMKDLSLNGEKMTATRLNRMRIEIQLF